MTTSTTRKTRRRHTAPDRTRGLLRRAAWFFFLVAALPHSASQAQTASPEYRVAHVRYEGDLIFSREQLELRTRTRGNRRLLNIPGATWWLWLHQFGGWIGGSFGRGLQSTGQPPRELDLDVVEADVQRLELFYNQEGFRRAAIDAVIDSTRGAEKVHVRFQIDPGPPTFIREVRYEGLDPLDTARRRALVEGSLLGDARAAGPEVDGDERYSEPLLLEEGRRILTFLRNTGYAFINRDSIHAVVIPVMPDSFDVVMDIRLGQRYRFGDLAYRVTGPETGVATRQDTLVLRRAGTSFEMPGSVEGDTQVDPDLLRRTLRFRPGQWFDQSLVDATKRRLDAVGVFAFTDVRPLPPDSGSIAIPHLFDLQTRDRHRIQLETFMLQRSGGFADSDNEIGTGIGVSYSNLNIFGEGEAFQLRSTGTIAADLGLQKGFTSTQWDISGTFSFPYLTWPVGGLDRRLGLFDARTRVSVSFLAARRDALRLVLRGRGNLSYRYELRHTPTLTSFVDVLDVSVSNPDTLAGFGDIFLDDVLASIDDPVQQGQIVEDYTQPQINNALRYTLRSGRVDPFRRDDGHAYEGSVEIGGNLPYLLDRFVFDPGPAQGTLPGLPFFGGSSSDDRLIYRQYLRGAVDLRRYHTIAPGRVLAWKTVVGVARPIGQADVVPFDRRFYSGGASSVRAWRLRELGPGSASFSDSVGVGGTNILGGEVKLEASVEHRLVVIRSLFEAAWSLALFVDAGNVWSGPRNPGPDAGRFRLDRFYKEIGVGSGVGLRLGWDYLIVRLDLAFKVHDPLRSGEFLPDGLSNFVPQFGIGHTF
ncbi:MAG: BamA/TamA family outer membrane protein [Rhodothermales bacterium]|nr:BamA/TamA family outer membrane protein [Rhodothermales bacterium]MBO6778486.1 BamA/TamA family outer membrane protein [Rhodothermales bacterium]